MAAVSWTRQAMDDLQAIHGLYARDTDSYAEVLVEELYEQADGLGDDPLRGLTVPEAADESIREIVHGPFRLVYRHRDNDVHILTVCPGCRPDGICGSYQGEA